MGIRIERDDGSARILGQRCDNGCAAETAYCQIAADELASAMKMSITASSRRQASPR